MNTQRVARNEAIGERHNLDTRTDASILTSPN